MKRISAAFFAACWLAVFPAEAANNFSAKKNLAKAPLEAPLQELTPGEKLIFDVHWLGFHVGEGTLEVAALEQHNGRPAYHVIAIARTNDFLTKIYPIHDEIHSWIDAEKWRTLEFRKDVREGKYRADEIVVYDHDAKTGHYESKKNGSKKDFPIEPGCHDLVSAFFWFRTQPAKPGQTVRTRVNGEEKHWDMEYVVEKREERELRGAVTVDALLVEPRTKLEGVLYNRGRAWVWFTADKRRLPFEVRIKTPFGPVTGVLRNRDTLTPSNPV